MDIDQPEALTCSVCGGAMTFAQSAECNWCDQRYHLNQRNDVEAQDCGQVWIDEQFLALQFACNAVEPPAPPSCRPHDRAGGRTAAVSQAPSSTTTARRLDYRHDQRLLVWTVDRSRTAAVNSVDRCRRRRADAHRMAFADCRMVYLHFRSLF
jgi:hypothetical protein